MDKLEELMKDLGDEESDPIQEDPFLEEVKSSILEILDLRLKSLEEKLDQLIEEQD